MEKVGGGVEGLGSDFVGGGVCCGVIAHYKIAYYDLFNACYSATHRTANACVRILDVSSAIFLAPQQSTKLRWGFFRIQLPFSQILVRG